MLVLSHGPMSDSYLCSAQDALSLPDLAGSQLTLSAPPVDTSQLTETVLFSRTRMHPLQLTDRDWGHQFVNWNAA